MPKCAGTSLRPELAKQTMCRLPTVNPTLPDIPVVLRDFKNYMTGLCWMSLRGWSQFDYQVAGPIDESTFEFSFIMVTTNDQWNFWVDKVKHKIFNEIIEVHLNMDPDPTDQTIYNHKHSVPMDLLTNKKYYDFDWMTVLRNPVDRVISEFHFIRAYVMWHPHKEYEYTISKPVGYWYEDQRTALGMRFWGHLPLEAHSDINLYAQLPETQNLYMKQFLGEGYLNDYKVTEEDYNKVIDGLERLDFKIGIFENLPDSIEYFNEEFGWTMNYDDMPFSRKNNNKPKDTDETKELIRDNNKWDIKLYNYYLDKFKIL